MAWGTSAQTLFSNLGKLGTAATKGGPAAGPTTLPPIATVFPPSNTTASQVMPISSSSWTPESKTGPTAPVIPGQDWNSAAMQGMRAQEQRAADIERGRGMNALNTLFGKQRSDEEERLAQRGIFGAGIASQTFANLQNDQSMQASDFNEGLTADTLKRMSDMSMGLLGDETNRAGIAANQYGTQINYLGQKLNSDTQQAVANIQAKSQQYAADTDLKIANLNLPVEKQKAYNGRLTSIAQIAEVEAWSGAEIDQALEDAASFFGIPNPFRTTREQGIGTGGELIVQARTHAGAQPQPTGPGTVGYNPFSEVWVQGR